MPRHTKLKKTKKRTIKRKNVRRRTYKKKLKKGGNVVDLWDRPLPETSNSTIGDIVNGIKNPSLHGDNTW